MSDPLLVAAFASPTVVAALGWVFKSSIARNLRNIDKDIKQALEVAITAQKDAQEAKTGLAVLGARVDALIAVQGKLEGILEKVTERQNSLADFYKGELKRIEGKS